MIIFQRQGNIINNNIIKKQSLKQLVKAVLLAHPLYYHQSDSINSAHVIQSSSDYLRIKKSGH